ncbi:hypothetical protein [Blautia sp. MSJ-19]|uniref:hypothetical protein n=1 Tax=Blautia sp. MSJ-19 TaxID=2841517 RepID=UPI001C0EB270|nr:hypothetical protein [Blautia sp. MSJ-19]MBU5480532.1 hypothetical protein [Blautia sp. MSJ-19]
MADEHKTDQNPEELENLSPEELQERIQEEKKNAKRSLRFAFTALLAIIAVCIAWFVANNRVSMTGTQISADNDRPFELASVGERLTDEEEYLKDADGNDILSAGTEEKYSKYIDINTGEEVSGEKIYHTGSSGLAWYMNSEESLIPGAGDELEFYLIPKKSGLTKVEISVDLDGYTFETTKKISKNTDSKIADLLNGHILFFRYLDATYGYHGWLGADRKITLNAPKQTVDGKTVTEFQKDVPYRVTLRWKWPKYLRNYIYTDRSYGDLFTAAMKTDTDKKEEYDKLIEFVVDQLNTDITTKDEDKKNKLFYDSQSATNSAPNPKISAADISTTLLDTYSSYYNQADEYIGTNIQYVYIQINVD